MSSPSALPQLGAAGGDDFLVGDPALQDANLTRTSFLRASLVGVDADGARLERTDLTEADLTWTTLTADRLRRCIATDTRLPEDSTIAHGPAKASVPTVRPSSLAPRPLDAAERRERAAARG